MDSEGSGQPIAEGKTPEEEFLAMYDAHRVNIFNLCRYLTSDRTEAEDVFQEVWLRVVRQLPHAPQRAGLRTWLFTIALNVHRDALRRKRVRRLFFAAARAEAVATGNEPDASVVSSDDPARSAESAVIGESIRRAIADLPARQRRVFVLKEIEGLGQAEIGRLLGIPLGTVKSLMHRAVKRLQKDLAAHRPDRGRNPCDVKIMSV